MSIEGPFNVLRSHPLASEEEKSGEENPLITEGVSLLDAIIQENTGGTLKYLELIEQERAEISAVERGVEKISKYDESLCRLAIRYGVDIELKSLGGGLVEVSINTYGWEALPSLPEGYGYKGGAARYMLALALGIDAHAPRDLDLVYCGVAGKQDSDVSRELSKKYMPDDYAHSYGVEVLESDYFDTRDFTLNEVIFDGKRVLCTRMCLLDTIRNIVRFSDFEKKDSWHGDEFFVSQKLMAKAIRFVAAAKARGEKMEFASGTDSLKNVFINEFHVALHLDRAMQQSAIVAQTYVNAMVSRGFLPESVKTTADAFEFLLARTDFVFRCVPENEIDQERVFLDEELERLEDETPVSPVSHRKGV